MREPTKEERNAVCHYLETMWDTPKFTEEELKRYCNRLVEVSIPSHFIINWLPVNGEEYHVFKCSNCGKYQTYKSNYCEDCGGVYLGEKD